MIAVLDFGSQYTHLINRRLRELGVYAEIFPHNIQRCKLPQTTKGLILSGGPMSVYEKNAPTLNTHFLTSDLPILGICYGHQLVAHKLGGQVEQGTKKEYGHQMINVNGGILLKGLRKRESVWFSHGDVVNKIPPGFTITATSNKQIAAYENGVIFGVQFHPEVAHTVHGNKILRNFIKVCGEESNWSIKDQVSRLVAEIRTKVGNQLVLIGVSGGIDSLIAALLLKKAIGKNLYCVFIETGFMRKDEPEEVATMYKNFGFENFISSDCKQEFLRALKGVTDPELKRKRIGHTFIRVFEKKAIGLQKQKHIKFLAQGTIYPDRIESAATCKLAVKIKSHHNLTLPKKINFQIIEPLKDFYKDEVRNLGKRLEVPKNFLMRHPFPGPGLAIRILGEVTEEKLQILKEADCLFIEELKRAKLYPKIWQAFAALLPVKTVGVMGDTRTYTYMLTLRAVTSKDGMTADWAKIPPPILEKISNRIVNEIKGVNRVVYDITQKPPATIEYE
ncbi:MAG: glutamine-hydrolyzing GMP synthase [bacterium]|nr:glutamine-hydrolyzing GMP synthase [bacterium]